MTEFNKNVNFYEILGLKEDANSEDIRKAYKKLALKWHPDKNQNNKDLAERKFKEIAEAYSILSNEKKKEEYDNFRKYGNVNNVENIFMDKNIDPRDIFKEFFGSDNPFENFGFGFGYDFNENFINDDQMSNNISMGFANNPFGYNDFFTNMRIPNFPNDNYMYNDYNVQQMQMSNFGNSGNVNRQGSTIINRTVQYRNGRRIIRTEKITTDEHGNISRQISEDIN